MKHRPIITKGNQSIFLLGFTTANFDFGCGLISFLLGFTIVRKVAAR
jgi:hypothetical protein